MERTVCKDSRRDGDRQSGGGFGGEDGAGGTAWKETPDKKRTQK